MHTKVILY